MKKVVLTAALMVAGVSFANAQVAEKTREVKVEPTKQAEAKAELKTKAIAREVHAKNVTSDKAVKIEKAEVKQKAATELKARAVEAPKAEAVAREKVE